MTENKTNGQSQGHRLRPISLQPRSAWSGSTMQMSMVLSLMISTRMMLAFYSVEGHTLIESAEEFVDLRKRNDPRASHDEAPLDVWFDVIESPWRARRLECWDKGQAQGHIEYVGSAPRGHHPRHLIRPQKRLIGFNSSHTDPTHVTQRRLRNPGQIV